MQITPKILRDTEQDFSVQLITTFYSLEKKTEVFMKKWFVILVGVLSFIPSYMVFAESDRSCTHTGTWYGGSEPYKYQYTFIPTVPAGRFTAIADGVYSPDVLGGAAVATKWSGEMVRRPGESAYEIRLIALASGYLVPPSEDPPKIWAVKGDVRFDGCNTLIIEYDWFAIYDWEKVPFVDDPEPYNWIVPPNDTIVETIKRMPMDTTLPVPPQ
jgi:hypothetical protein